MALRRLCVFCGSRAGARPDYAELADELGRLMAARGIALVYGGSRVGLMQRLADAVLAGGGTAIGVIPHSLVDREIAHPGLTELHVVDTLHQRKALMADLSDGFTALPGGVGTMDELFDIVTWRALGLHHKPIALLDAGGFFAPLRAMLDHMMVEGFLDQDVRSMIASADRPEALLDALAAAA
ncbi:MAG TPA: TIGR00730 family Rossman fold protein [Kofleriaceae bacterium]|nr:TIGR00730 family Rossman fold protein [Kofleriaceae bacterium]